MEKTFKNTKDFNLEYRMSHGNMHIDLEGNFDQSSAKQFITCLTKAYEGTGRVFVDTAKLKELSESGIQYFRDFLSTTKLLAHNLYLKGEQGFQLVPNGSKVLLVAPKSKEKSNHVSGCACGGTCGGANAKHDHNADGSHASGHKKCKVCKCALARQRAAQKMERDTE